MGIIEESLENNLLSFLCLAFLSSSSPFARSFVPAFSLLQELSSAAVQCSILLPCPVPSLLWAWPPPFLPHSPPPPTSILTQRAWVSQQYIHSRAKMIVLGCVIPSSCNIHRTHCFGHICLGQVFTSFLLEVLTSYARPST